MIIAQAEGIPSVTIASFPSYEEAETAFKNVTDFNDNPPHGVFMVVRATRLYRKA